MVADPELQSPPGTAPSPEVLRPFWTSDIQGRLDHFAIIRARSGGIETTSTLRATTCGR